MSSIGGVDLKGTIREVPYVLLRSLHTNHFTMAAGEDLTARRMWRGGDGADGPRRSKDAAARQEATARGPLGQILGDTVQHWRVSTMNHSEHHMIHCCQD